MSSSNNISLAFLAIDIGNTHTVIGFFEGMTLKDSWRIRTEPYVTADELAIEVNQLLGFCQEEIGALDDIVICSVVPPVLGAWKGLAKKYLGKDAVIITGQSTLGMPIKYKRPYELGADRIVNAIAGYRRFPQALIIIDFGTAITFDCISSQGEYLGGIIAPGITLASDALFKGTSKLPKVDLFAPLPASAICQDTQSAMHAGCVWGFAGLTTNILKKLYKEFALPPKVIATGGLASLIAPFCPDIQAVLPDLTLEGIALAHNILK